MFYLKIEDKLYPAGFRQRVQDADWNNRGTWAITVEMSHAQASELFVDGLQWQQVQQRQPYMDEDGNKITPEPVIIDCSAYEIAGPITDNRDGTVTVKMGKPTDAELLAILTGEVQ